MKHINILEYSFRHCFRIKSPLLLRTGMLLFLAIFFFKTTKAQRADPPVIKYVTVDPYTDSVKIVWEASPFPDILTYEIYYGTDIHNRPLVAVVHSSTTSYVDYSGLSQMQSVYYSIAAIGSGFRSPFSANHRTIFLEARYDSCSATAHITWTPYIGWDSDLTSYKLYASRGGRPFEAIRGWLRQIHFIRRWWTLETRQICYYVEAINSSKGYVSSSNRACINTPMQVIPAYMDASGTVDNGSISLNFAVDPSSEITNYLLEEAPGPGGRSTH